MTQPDNRTGTSPAAASSSGSAIDALIDALQRHSPFDHDIERFEVLRTHISVVLLTGPFAYKFKLPVSFDFADFSTLERRRHYCEEELRLNRRLAPQLYLEVVRITRDAGSPTVNGSGEPIEYAVKMVQFPQTARLDRVLDRGDLAAGHIDDCCEQVVEFHRHAAIADRASSHGRPETIREQVLGNFELLRESIHDAPTSVLLEQLHAWTREQLTRCDDSFRMRKRTHRIRECHGDLHLANIALLDGRVVCFDCLEFNESLRWIDVMSEVAFVLMDLAYRGQPARARRFLNGYLERSGDYDGLALLRFYQVYRALVRAKVALLNAPSPGSAPRTPPREVARHLEFARDYLRDPEAPQLMITHGLSGSGKTTVTQTLLEHLDAIRIRSDIERKRLAGLRVEDRSGSPLAGDLYMPRMDDATYARLAELAGDLLTLGYPVIVDAAFLERGRRNQFARLAAALGVPFRILDIRADGKSLQQRVARRAAEGRDASEADLDVLRHQLEHHQPLTDGEAACAIVIDTNRPLDANWVLRRLSDRRATA